MTQRAQLSAEDEAALAAAMERWREADAIRSEVRATVVEMLAASSYGEVARLTGFSTNTLQRWKREAK